MKKDFETIIVADRNRDGAKLWFEHLHDYVYVIKTDTPFVLNYCRIISSENDTDVYEGFDPSGGPMICIGDKFGNKTIKKIFNENNQICFELV